MRRTSLTSYLTSFLLGVFLFPSVGYTALNEDEIKIAYLINFVEFTAWPEQTLPITKRTLNLCFVGRDELNETMLALDKRLLQDRQVRVLHLSLGASLNTCQVAFFETVDDEALRDILHGIASTAILTVSDTPRFAEMGGMIELFSTEDSKIRFRINQGAASQANLTLSSKLLQLADIIYRQQP